MSGRKICLNCPSVYYTGREQSPLHFGLSAEGYEINSIMEGFDKELWIVEVRNNKKVWTKKEHINKMTYEIPLINEFTDTKDTEIAVEANNINATNDTNTTVDETGDCNKDESHILKIAVNDDNDISETTKNKAKSNKTANPTDYTLFITYRIHQMKEKSSDNKKNYDCARFEWKEYKKKPEELRLIMAEANNFQKVDSKINKK
jgi:hypothetical protein